MTYFKRSKRSDKGQHRTRQRFRCGEYLCKITKRYRQFLQSYSVQKAAWPWASLKVWKCHTKVNIELIRDFYIENIHVKLQHGTGNLLRVIIRKVPEAARPGNDNTLQPKGLRGKNSPLGWWILYRCFWGNACNNL